MHQSNIRHLTMNKNIFVFFTLLSAATGANLELQDARGLQQFSQIGFLLDDVTPARLEVKIDLQPALNMVSKIKHFIGRKSNRTSIFGKTLQSRAARDLQPALDRLRDTEQLVFKAKSLPNRIKRQFFGVAATAMAAYAVYDVNQLRGTTTEIKHAVAVSRQRLNAAVGDISALARAQRATANILNSLHEDMSELHQFLQLINLAQTTANYCYQTAAAIDEVLNHRLTTGLVPLEDLDRGFNLLKHDLRRLGLEPVIDDAKQAYQLEASFEALVGEPLKVSVEIPTKPRDRSTQYSLLSHRRFPFSFNASIWTLAASTELLGLSTEDGTFITLDTTELHTCSKLGETFLCNNIGTVSLQTPQSCTAAIYLEDSDRIMELCQPTRLNTAAFLQRVNSSSFVSYSAVQARATVRCGTEESRHMIHGLQLGQVQPGCTFVANGLSFHSPRTPSSTMTSIHRYIPDVPSSTTARPWNPAPTVYVDSSILPEVNITVPVEPAEDVFNRVTSWWSALWSSLSLVAMAAGVGLLVLAICYCRKLRTCAKRPTSPAKNIKVMFSTGRPWARQEATAEPPPIEATDVPPQPEATAETRDQCKTVAEMVQFHNATRLGKLLEHNREKAKTMEDILRSETL